jgi:hypothetical protein
MATRQGRCDSIPDACLSLAYYGSSQWLIGLYFPYAGRRQPMKNRLDMTNEEPRP